MIKLSKNRRMYNSVLAACVFHYPWYLITFAKFSKFWFSCQHDGLKLKFVAMHTVILMDQNDSRSGETNEKDKLHCYISYSPPLVQLEWRDSVFVHLHSSFSALVSWKEHHVNQAVWMKMNEKCSAAAWHLHQPFIKWKDTFHLQRNTSISHFLHSNHWQ